MKKGDKPMAGVSIATWNTWWATSSSVRGSRISAVLEAVNADVVVVTEGVRELLPGDGFVADAGGDWGYGRQLNRRKVIVWSRLPLSCDVIGEHGATRGRLVVAKAATLHGPVRIVGVCIPWRHAHVSTGRGDAQPWSEHLDYLDRLQELLAGFDDAVPTVIAGDFNQRIPRGHQPVRVAERLNDVLADWTIHTAGRLPNGPHIDHVASDRRLGLEWVRDWPASDHLGRLSDHAGVICCLAIADTTALQAANFQIATDPARVEQDERIIAVDDSIRGFGSTPFGPVLTPELREEIEHILRQTPDGFEHGVGFRLREQGLTDAEIVNKSSGIGTTRRWLNSLDRLLGGTRPTSNSAALDTSYAYRELFNHQRSDDLDRYARAWLHELKTINPDEVNFEPLNTRQRKHKLSQRKSEQPKATEQPCPECGTFHAGEC